MSDVLRLQKPWSVKVFTQDQAKHKKDATAGRDLWLDVLNEHHARKMARIGDPEDVDVDAEPDSDFESDEDFDSSSEKDSDSESSTEGELDDVSDDDYPNGAEDDSIADGDSMEVDSADVPSDSATIPSHSDIPFRFLKLAAELRNMIYGFYLVDYKRVRAQRLRQATLARRNEKRNRNRSRSWRPLPSPSPDSKRRQEAFRKERDNFKRLFTKHLARAKADATMSPGAIQVFQKYMGEHTMKIKPVKRGRRRHRDANGDCGNLRVDIRGYVCSDLPMLCLVNRQIFKETFNLVYPTISSDPTETQASPTEDVEEAADNEVDEDEEMDEDEDMDEDEGAEEEQEVDDDDAEEESKEKKAEEENEEDEEPARSKVLVAIANFDIFPFLRFCQNFGMYTSINERDIEIEWKAHERSKHIHLGRNMRRLIELHWLQGFPLWSCFTRLPPFGTKRKAGFMPDFLICARETVAFYRLDLDKWRAMSIKYICRCELIDFDELSEPN